MSIPLRFCNFAKFNKDCQIEYESKELIKFDYYYVCKSCLKFLKSTNHPVYIEYEEKKILKTNAFNQKVLREIKELLLSNDLIYSQRKIIDELSLKSKYAKALNKYLALLIEDKVIKTSNIRNTKYYYNHNADMEKYRSNSILKAKEDLINIFRSNKSSYNFRELLLKTKRREIIVQKALDDLESKNFITSKEFEVKLKKVKYYKLKIESVKKQVKAVY